MCGIGDVAAEWQSERGHLQEAAGAHCRSCSHQPSAAAARWGAQRGHMHAASASLLSTWHSHRQHTLKKPGYQPARLAQKTCLLSGIAHSAFAKLTCNATWHTWSRITPSKLATCCVQMPSNDTLKASRVVYHMVLLPCKQKLSRACRRWVKLEHRAGPQAAVFQGVSERAREGGRG